MTFPQKNVAFNNPTPVSNILKILIKTCIIPLKITKSEKSTSVTFRFRSKQTLVFWIYQWIFFGTALFLMVYMTGFKPLMTWLITKFSNSNIIDFISFLCILIYSLIKTICSCTFLIFCLILMSLLN